MEVNMSRARWQLIVDKVPKNITVIINGEKHALNGNTTLLDLIQKYEIKSAKIVGNTIEFSS